MPEYTIVLVEPKHPGNIGAVARVMANFGVRCLALVNPCPLDDSAHQRAMHARSILESAEIYPVLEEALAGHDIIVGTSAIHSRNDGHFLRQPLTPKDLAERMSVMEGRVAVLFGREDCGLYNEELERCDIMVTIPCTEGYGVMNVSHAVAVLLYEIHQPQARVRRAHTASGTEKEQMMRFFGELLDAIGYPEHRREKTTTMFRRMMGRAVPTKWEFYTIAGILRRAAKWARKGRGNGG